MKAQLSEWYNEESWSRYVEYQARYARSPRESDKVLASLIRELLPTVPTNGRKPTLLDIGCSTGNFLLLLKQVIPDLQLSGGDIIADVIDTCKADANLAGVHFKTMDMLNLPQDHRYDFVVANAAMPFFSPTEFQEVARNIAAVLNPGGWFLAFDWFHPFEQELTIIETYELHPDGWKFYFRPYTKVWSAFEQAGFGEPTFLPFSMPCDLPNSGDMKDLTSYTVETKEKKRLSFRGALCQPWCHFRARLQA